MMKIVIRGVSFEVVYLQWNIQKKLINLHKDLLFLSERKKIGKYNKFVCNIHDKENYVVHIRALKQVLNHELIFQKVHGVIEFNQQTWLENRLAWILN